MTGPLTWDQLATLPVESYVRVLLACVCGHREGLDVSAASSSGAILAEPHHADPRALSRPVRP
jgi:hypothetical protein